MKNLISLVVLISCPSVFLSAQQWTTRRFDAPPDQVYKAAVRVIALHHDIMSKEPEIRNVRFHIGTTALSWGYNVGLSVEPRSDGTSVAKVAIEKSGGPVFSRGSGKKEILKIFRWMEEDLTQKHPETTPKN